MEKKTGTAKQIEFASLEDSALKDHILRDVDRAIDFRIIETLPGKALAYFSGEAVAENFWRLYQLQ